MALIDIDKGSIYITNEDFDSSNFNNDQIDDSNIIVRVDDQKAEEDLQNTLVEFNIPVTPRKKDTTAPNAQLIDLKRFKHVVGVQGVLATDTTEDAFTKKKNLKILAGYGNVVDDKQMVGGTMKSGAVTVVRGLNANDSQERYRGNIGKIKITEVPGKISDGTKDTKTDVSYSVQIQISVGTERG